MQQARPAAAGQAGLPLGMPFQLIQNINTLSELSGIPVHVLGNPGMQLAAQQLVAQRLMQQQLLAGQLRPVMPAQMLAMQQAQLQQRMGGGGSGGGKKGGGGKKRGRGAAAAHAAPPPMPAYTAPLQPPRPANPYADPGGKVVWAKVGSYPWWPAKLLDPARDLSYPPDADPPRPTSIPIRFFGTFEFQWIGSKRQLTDWEEGLEQFSRECDQPEFKAAIAEVERYRAGGRLPDVFYATPEPEKPRAKARGKKRQARGSEGAEAAAAALVGHTKARAAGRAAEPQEDRSAVVQRRKKQRLQELGLLPPDDSPFTGGRLAPNPNLLLLKPEWEQQYASVIAEHKQQRAALAERRRALADARAKAAAEAKAVAEAAAAASVAAPVPAPAGAVPAAALAGLPGQLAAQQGQQGVAAQMQMAFMQQLMSMQGTGGALPVMPRPS